MDVVDASFTDIFKIALPLLATALAVVIGGLVKMALFDRDKKSDHLMKHHEDLVHQVHAAHAEIKVLQERSTQQLKALERLDQKLDALERELWETS